MKRKLIQLAKTTMVVSLPLKWVREHNLSKGDEIEMETNNRGLTILLQGAKTPVSRKTVDLSGQTRKLAERITAAAYKQGHDGVELTFSGKEELEGIYSFVRMSGIGFEIVDESKNRIVLKSIAAIDSSEFNSILRRLFLSLISFSRDVLEGIKSKDSEFIKRMPQRDEIINKYSDFCRRALNRSEDIGVDRRGPVYVIVDELEKIGDMFKLLAQKYDPAKPEAIEEMLAGTNAFLQAFYELYYQFDLQRAKDFVIVYEKLNASFKKGKAGQKGDCQVAVEIIARKIYDLAGSVLVCML